MNIAITGLAALATVLVTSAASAGEFRVRLHPSELETSVGVDRVYTRIERAAERACEMHKIAPLYERRAARECKAEMINYAVKEVAHPALYARHETNHSRGRMARN